MIQPCSTCPAQDRSIHPPSAQTGGAAIARPHFTIIEAPSVLGLLEKGVETLPDALLAKGLGERLKAQRAGRVGPPQNDHRRDPETMLLNPRGIAAYSVALADVVERVIDMGEFPVVLGGDCSICGLLARP